MRILFLFLFLVSCGERSKLIFNVRDDEIEVSEELIQSISYKEVNEKVFQNKCIGCHGTSGGINLETYKAASSNLEAIKDSTIIRKTMPKSPVKALSQNELQLITAWVAAGGPDLPLNGSNGGGGNGPVLEPTYASIKAQIIDRKCLSCHSAGGNASRMPFTTKDELLDSPYDIVVPNNPEESGLMIVLEQDARKPMPPQNSGFSPVSEAEKVILKEWILKGAP